MDFKVGQQSLEYKSVLVSQCLLQMYCLGSNVTQSRALGRIMTKEPPSYNITLNEFTLR